MFYDWLETNPVSDSSIVLWHALMNINNKCGWKVEFAAAISTLSVKTGLKKDAIIRARLRLQQAERIDFISRSGQLSALYRIHYFDDCVVLNDSNRNTNRAQTATQTASIPKLNETKVFNNINAEGDLSKIEIGNTIEFLDRIKQLKISSGEVVNYWEAFLLNGQEPAYYSREKKIQHFRNWLKNQKNGNAAITNGNKTHSANGTSTKRIEALKQWGE